MVSDLIGQRRAEHARPLRLMNSAYVLHFLLQVETEAGAYAGLQILDERAQVGGGAVAMDCAVTAKRLGADRVYAVSLESMEELPADDDEKDLAFREGIRFKPNCRLTGIASEDGEISGAHGVEIRADAGVLAVCPGCTPATPDEPAGENPRPGSEP